MDFSEEFKYKGPAVKNTATKRGKGTESALDKAFAKLKGESIHFDYERIPDAFSSRGGISSPRTGDFILFYRGRTLVVEAKETKNLKALPASSFSADSRARLRRRAYAGIGSVVIIYHPALGTYRIAQIADFDCRVLGSFDLTNYNHLTLQEVITTCLQFLTTSTLGLTEAQEQPLVQN